MFRYIFKFSNIEDIILLNKNQSSLEKTIKRFKKEYPELVGKYYQIMITDAVGRDLGGIKKTKDGKWEVTISI